jgi:hypothetical protein
MDLIAVVSARLNRWFDPRNITRVTIIKEAVSEWAYLGKKKKVFCPFYVRPCAPPNPREMELNSELECLFFWFPNAAQHMPARVL